MVGVKTYNKLVRDRIPEMIEADGKTCEVEVLSDAAFLKALLDKLVEEAQEARDASPSERMTELADVFEVMDAVMRAEGVSEFDVRVVQRQRR